MLGFNNLVDFIWWVFGLEGVPTDRPDITPSAEPDSPRRSDFRYSDKRRKKPEYPHTWRRPTLSTVPEATHSAASEWGGTDDASSGSTQAPEKSISADTRAGFHRYPVVSSAQEEEKEEEDKYAAFADISPKQTVKYRGLKRHLPST